MSLKTYDRILTPPPAHWPLYPLKENGKPNKARKRLRPGDWVTHREQGGKGLIVAVSADEVSVLWSVEPKAPSPFSRFAFPLVRKVYPQALAHQLVSVQPMSMPSGNIFYMDYKYGSGSLGAQPVGPADTGPETGPTVGP